jgi:Abnormal spindle-like microcephaly-assoc'd, ASPM-SPD-2-Hydin
MVRLGTVVWTLILGGLVLTTLAFANTDKTKAVETYPSGFAISQRASDLPIEPSVVKEEQIHEPGPSPLRSRGTHQPLLQEDPVLQKEAKPLVAATPGISFSGIPSPGYVPSDSNLAVGPNHIVEVVNVEYAVYSKSGATLAGPTNIQTLFSKLGGVCAGTFGDPVALYDRAADRWLISFIGSNSAGTVAAECVAVSKTNDPTGAYYLYGYSFGSNLNDYPKLGTWATTTNSAYLVSYNIFAGGSSFNGADLCGFDRTKMLAGNASPAMLCQMTPKSEGSYLPSDMDGPTPPVDGTPGLFITWQNNNPGQLYLRKLTLNFAAGTATLSAATTISVANDTLACGTGGTCVPQAGTSQTLDTLGDRLMYRFAVRHFSDHDRAVVNHAVGSGSQVAVRWYELYDPAGSVTLNQQGTYAPDTTYRWMASVAEDKLGDIGMGYSASSTTIDPAIRFTGRMPTDTLGTMESEDTVLQGAGAQTGSGISRWGDYTAMQVDPSDDCTFWYVDQYQAVTGVFDWSTNISSFAFPSCTGAQAFSLGANPGSVSIQQGSNGTSSVTVTPINGFSGSVTLSASGLPGGATAVFNPNPTTSTSTLTLTVGSTAPTNTYNVSLNGVSGSLTNQTTIQLTVTSAPAAPIVTLTPVSLTWAGVVVGTTTASKTVTLKNTGAATLNLANVAPSGDFAISSSTCLSTLAAGKSCLIKVTFTPTQVGARSGAITLTDNASDSPQSVPLSGTGTVQATLTPVTATYATAIKVGATSAAKVFTLTNKQGVDLTGVSISTTGDFSVSSTTCSSSVAAKSSCKISVTFTPTQTGTRTGTLQVSDDTVTSPQTSSLAGTGK